jgi:hypothetical protein
MPVPRDEFERWFVENFGSLPLSPAAVKAAEKIMRDARERADSFASMLACEADKRCEYRGAKAAWKALHRRKGKR